MVTAGVFMVCRLSPMFEFAPDAKMVVTVVGAATALFAATIGLVQNDIKRVIAYSTCSQLGYMFFAAGVGAYGAAMFHLFTHAFFKALLFLCAGSVIHGMSDEQDMRRMGGIWKLMPWTYGLMWIGSLALAGIPFFAGYYSKDIILESAFAAHTGAGTFAFWLGVGAALMTAFYSWRLILMTFHGETRADHETYHHVHESPWVILVPLIVLAVGAVFSGYLGYEYFVGHDMEHFWGASVFFAPENEVPHHAHEVPTWVKLVPLAVGIVGIAIAYLLYMFRTDLPGKIAGATSGLYRFLLNKWYFDELYEAIFVRPAKALGFGLWKGGDGAVIDGLGPDGISQVTIDLAKRASKLQSGYVYHYAFVMLLGVAGLLTYALWAWNV